MTPHQVSGCTCSPAAGGSPCCGSTRTVDSTITFANRLDHFLARWGINRNGHRVDPGLYRLGNPTTESPVFASANYTLSFDALRSALAGYDAYILVLDTKGINVWCAAGKVHSALMSWSTESDQRGLPASSTIGKLLSRNSEPREYLRMRCSAGLASGSNMARCGRRSP